MSTDAKLPVAKYPDEVWIIPIDWSPALVAGDAIAGTPTVIGVGCTAVLTGVAGTVTVVTVSGGGPVADNTARIELLVITAAGEDLGFNLGIGIRPR